MLSAIYRNTTALPLHPEISDQWNPYYHENGFDHNLSPAIVSEESVGLFSWGLIPWFTKSPEDAARIQNSTLNAISEEMFSKPSFRDALKDGKRCLIPFTGFFEWRWEDSAGKNKTPHYIFLKDQKIFSIAAIYSVWKNPTDGKMVYTYSLLTTQANELMANIHNSKKRMPVILPRAVEREWLRPNLQKADVLDLCRPLDSTLMDAYPISKRITSRKEPTNVPEVLQRAEKTTLF